MYTIGFICDVCGREIAWEANSGTASKDRARGWARKKGWTFGKQDKCPDCARKKKGRDA